MHNVRAIAPDVYWIGASDRRISLFENVFPVPRGASYNSYLVDGEKTVLLDTVDKAVAGVFLENLEYALAGRALDYLIINHMEPDHCALIKVLAEKYPSMKFVANEKAAAMIGQFFGISTENRVVLVKEGDSLAAGRHTFRFIMAPMVHWPECMVTYDESNKFLFSADAFGSFGALNGNIFADEVNFEGDRLDDARRYYSNIVGKYGPQVQSLLKKAEGLEINAICPLHGLIWRENIPWLVEKYRKWSAYEPEEQSVLIAYSSVYGNTENAVDILAGALAQRGVRDIAMYDVSSTHPSVIVSEAFRRSHLVFAATTYNAGIFVNMETVLADLSAHNLQNRTVALIENGSWFPASGGLARKIFEQMKNVTILDRTLTIKSALKENQLADVRALADAIVSSM